jgi:hypothetical protein
MAAMCGHPNGSFSTMTAAQAATTGPIPPAALVGPGPIVAMEAEIMKLGMTVHTIASTRASQ